jgi:hypothetical protein
MRVRSEKTISASEFKAKCLDIFDQLAARKLHRVFITKRGRLVAVLTPPDAEAEIASLHGFMRGSVIVPAGVDLTAPALDEPMNANEGRVHD